MTEQVNNNIVLNDDCEINVTLDNQQWNAVVDWLAHSPFEEAKQTLTTLNTQIQQYTNDQTKSDTSFVAHLPIKTFNMLIFALGQAPYYVVAEIIQSIYQQGHGEINRLREQANTMKQQETPVEKSPETPDNTNQKKPVRKKRTTKRATKNSAE